MTFDLTVEQQKGMEVFVNFNEEPPKIKVKYKGDSGFHEVSGEVKEWFLNNHQGIKDELAKRKE